MAETTTSPSPRMPLELEIEFRKSYSRSSDTGTLRNISLSGAFIEANGEFERNDKINITFEVSGRKRKLAAKVVWANGRGAGIMFQHFNNRDLQIVDDLMYFVENSRSTRRNVFDNILKKVA